MKFFIDRCAGHRLAEWLRGRGFDVAEAQERGPDPGDAALLEQAAAEGRVLVTIDRDFGQLVFVGRVPHCGLVRLPDVPAHQRVTLMEEVIDRFPEALATKAIITVRKGRIRVSRSPEVDEK